MNGYYNKWVRFVRDGIIIRRLTEAEIARVNTIHQVPYNPQYPAIASSVARTISGQIAPESPLIIHVGSTAIPDMSGKGVIDLAIICTKPDEQSRIGTSLSHAMHPASELGWSQSTTGDTIRYGVASILHAHCEQHVLAHILLKTDPRLEQFLIVKLLALFPEFCHVYKQIKIQAFEASEVCGSRDNRFAYSKEKRLFLNNITNGALNAVSEILGAANHPSGRYDWLMTQCTSTEQFLASDAGEVLRDFVQRTCQATKGQIFSL